MGNDINEIFDEKDTIDIPQEKIEEITEQPEQPKKKRGRPKKSEKAAQEKAEQIQATDEELQKIERLAFIATLQNITAVFGEKWKMSDEEAQFCGNVTIDFLDRYFPNWRIESVLLNFVAAWSLYFTRRINFGNLKRKFFRK